MEIRATLTSYFQEAMVSTTEPPYKVTHFEYAEYVPEIDRYGGPNAISLAEQHFHVSSAIVIKLIRNSDNWDYDAAIGYAFQLHLTFVVSIQLAHQDIMTLLTIAYEGWLNNFLSLNPGFKRGTIVDAFDRSYDKQKQKLVTHLKLLKNGINTGTDDSDWLASWMQETIKTNTYLQKTIELDNPHASKQENQSTVISIYNSYIHMTNNRLGLNNIDESFIAYCLAKIYDDL